MRARKSRKHPPRPSPPTAADLSVVALVGGGYRVGIRGRAWSAEGATEREALERLIDDLDAYYAANFPPNHGAVSSERKQLMLLRDGYRCVNCGSDRNLTVDHKVPISRGGNHDLKNTQTLCEPCNQRKGSSLVLPSVPKRMRTGGVRGSAGAETPERGPASYWWSSVGRGMTADCSG